jgi:dihydroxy-acid dehydratase
VGGIPALLKYLLARTDDLIDGTQLTVTGRTLAENVADAAELFVGSGTGTQVQDVVRPLGNPIKRTGHIAILRGNLAPGSAVAKITGAEGVRFEGTARCFDDEDTFYPALAAGEIGPGMVLIFRYQGPKGAPGMPEVCIAKPSSLFFVPDTEHRRVDARYVRYARLGPIAGNPL